MVTGTVVLTLETELTECQGGEIWGVHSRLLQRVSGEPSEVLLQELRVQREAKETQVQVWEAACHGRHGTRSQAQE